MSNVPRQLSNGDGLPQQEDPTLTDFSDTPPPDLTLHIIKTDRQYVAGGGFGDVYRCRCLHDLTSREVQVAVKALRFKFTLDGDTKDKSFRMVRRELGIWKSLHHNNIVPFLGIAYGFGMDGTMALVSLWMPNDTLPKFLAAHDDKLDVVHRLQILFNIAEGLDYLHSLKPKIVHGDLNSNNVLIDINYAARLTDFGYASCVGNIPEALGCLQRSTSRPGALRWIAPEQIDLKESFIRTTKSDIYSFGSIALEVLSGKHPWSEVREDAAVVLHLHLGHKPGRPESRTIDDSHWSFIQQCWSPLEERPSANTLIHSIRQFLRDYPPSPLGDLFISPSSRAQDSLSASSLSLTVAQSPSVLETIPSPPSPLNLLPAQHRPGSPVDSAVSSTNPPALHALHQIQNNFASIPSPPDLTPSIIKIDNHCVAVGAFGDVYRCRYVRDSTSQEVAVMALRFKFTLDGDTKDKSFRMVRRELGVWTRLTHSNIVPFLGIAYGFGMDGAMSLVSLWMHNKTLPKFLKTYDDKLEIVHRLQILLDVAKGLDYLHSFRPEIAHGDLNSDNVLLGADYTARLAGFGCASLVGNIPEALGYLQRSTTGPGTLRWVAPEQIDLKGPSTRTTMSDIYSFGCVALEVLSGRQPWSEVREDAAVVLHLYLGHKPGRPESRTIDDPHWDVIQCCWLPVQERPSAAVIIFSIQKFLSEYPPSVPLRDSLIPPSSQAQDSLSGSSVSLAAARLPSPLAATTSPLSPLNRSTDSTSALSAPHTIHSGGTHSQQPASVVRHRFKANPDDFIIVVMGPTGSGKTNFINALTGNQEKTKASNLDSATQNVTPHTIQYRGFRLVLVDTPGFDDTSRPDTIILKLIADWLTKKYPDGETLRLSGIIYLHRITDNRMTGSAYKNLQMFGRLCGNLPLHRARLVTTMWDQIKDQQVAENREKELIKDFWLPLMAEGAVAQRFGNTHASASQLVDELIAIETSKEELLLQEELVAQQKRLNETKAGKLLYSRFQKLLVEQKDKLKELADETKMQNDPALASSLQEEYEKINTMLQQTFEELKEMKIPFTRRILLWLFGRFRKPRAKAVKLDEPFI